MLLAVREQLVLGTLIEHVVDDLHRIDEPALERTQYVARLPAIDADTEGAHEALVLERAQGALPAIVGRPLIGPDVQLLQVECRDADVLQTLLGVLADVVGGEDVVERVRRPRRPLAVLRGNLGGDVETLAGMSLQRLAQQPLAMPVAVGPGRIEEVASELDRPVERRERLLVVAAGPPCHAPHAVADFSDLPAGPAKRPITHGELLLRWRAQGSWLWALGSSQNLRPRTRRSFLEPKAQSLKPLSLSPPGRAGRSPWRRTSGASTRAA